MAESAIADKDTIKEWLDHVKDTHTLEQMKGIVLEGLYHNQDTLTAAKQPTKNNDMAIHALKEYTNQLDQVIINDLKAKNEKFVIPDLHKRPEIGLYISLIPSGEGSGKILGGLDGMLIVRDTVTKDLRDLRKWITQLKKTKASQFTIDKFELRNRWVTQQRDIWTKWFARTAAAKKAKKREKKRKFEEAFEDAINKEFESD